MAKRPKATVRGMDPTVDSGSADTAVADVGLLRAGQVLDRYTVEDMLGSGAMAVVYRVRHQQLGSLHALKLLNSSRPGLTSRLIREGQVQSSLRHPNIVAVTDVIEVDGAPGLVMEYIDGPSLDKLLAGCRLDLQQVDSVAVDIIRGVATAHGRGLVHRDLKPANVLMQPVDDRLVAKVADFGIAKVFAESTNPESVSLTLTGATMGTPLYMAPEQIRDSSRVDKRADVFALGAILYECATGERAFMAPDIVEVFGKITRGEYVPPRERVPTLPESMARAIERALCVDPQERVQSCEELLSTWIGDRRSASADVGAHWAPADLRAAVDLHQTRTLLPDSGKPEKRRPWLRRWWWIGPAVALVAGLVLVSAWANKKDDVPQDTLSVAPTLVAQTSRRLTRQVGSQLFPSLSSDGRQVIYSDTKDIFLLRINGGNPLTLTADFEPAATEPEYSHDGNQIAFSAAGAVYVMGATGEQPRKVAEPGYWPTWSPDDSEIAYTTADDWDVFEPMGDAALRRVHVSSGKDVLVTDKVTTRRPDWSPDGQRILFGSDAGVTSVQPDGQGFVKTGVHGWNPRWAQDGKSFFAIRQNDEAFEIARWNIDSRSGKTSRVPSAVVEQRTNAIWHFDVDKKERRIITANMLSDSVVVQLPFDPRREEVLGPPTRISPEMTPLMSPTLSPDGKRLALASWTAAEELFVAASDGTGLKKISDGYDYTRAPDWSPDGKRIAFHGTRRMVVNGKRQKLTGVFTVNPDGGSLTYLSSGIRSSLSRARFHPTEDRMAVYVDGVGPCVFDLEKPWAAQVEKACRPDAKGWYPASFTRDGEWLAFAAHGGGIARVHVKSREAQELLSYGYDAEWLADGRRLLVVTDRRLLLYDTRKKSTKELRSLEPGRVNRQPSLAISPDNRVIYASVRTEAAFLWLTDYREANKSR